MKSNLVIWKYLMALRTKVRFNVQSEPVFIFAIRGISAPFEQY